MADDSADQPAVSASLAASLAPRLEEACGGRLHSITWFRTDWQRGGAATGYARWDHEDVVVKLPVNRRELSWMRRLHERCEEEPQPVVPRLFASGEELGGYDLAWVVMERFAHGPLGMAWQDDHVARLADAIAAFHRATSPFPITDPPRREAWAEHIEGGLTALDANPIADQQRWRKALKDLRGKLDRFAECWESRPATDWLHGDPHFANAMTRSSAADAPVALIDLAEVRAGHWVEDALYMERQLWGRPELIKALKPLRAVARARKDAGLSNGPGHARLAGVRRTLLAGSAPRFIRSEGHPRHLQTCLELLEEGLELDI